MEKKTIAEKIREIRKTCGFTQQQIAAILNVDRSTYTYYETGKTTPDIHTIKVLANLFNVSVDDLLADEFPSASLHDSESPAHNSEADKLPETANQLTRTERELLLYYRSLLIHERVEVLEMLRARAEDSSTKK